MKNYYTNDRRLTPEEEAFEEVMLNNYFDTYHIYEDPKLGNKSYVYVNTEDGRRSFLLDNGYIEYVQNVYDIDFG